MIKDIVMGLVKPIADLYGNRQKRKAAESAAKGKIDEIIAEAAAKDSSVAGQVALINAANANHTWKDEYALIIATSPFVLMMLTGALEVVGLVAQGTASQLAAGIFAPLADAPEWWAQTFQAAIWAALGITGVKKLVK
tara:strand:+ start:678 stop:1091 length:414 start_codon:yes stop_codon:yes gene_type:complete